MPPPPKIDELPAEVRQELHLRVIHSGFSGYHGHSEWLKSQGHDISHTAVWTYFKRIKEDVQKQLTALAVVSQAVPLYAALAKEAGEDFTLGSEYMLQAATHAKLQEAIAGGDMSIEDLAAFQELSRSQRLTRVRAARERALAAETRSPDGQGTDTAGTAGASTDVVDAIFAAVAGRAA